MMMKIRFQMPVRSMTLTTIAERYPELELFQMPVRSMTLTTDVAKLYVSP